MSMINYLFLNKSVDKDSDFSYRKYKKKDYILEKYEKFKPRKSSKIPDTLKGAANNVKNMLSVFLDNIETEKRNSLHLRNTKTQKSHKINLKIVKTKNSENSFKKKPLLSKSKSRKMINLFDKNQNHFNNIKSNIDQIKANSFSNKIVYHKDGNKLMYI